MLTSSNKIIIVDNELQELYRLGKVFLDCGLTCKTFEYDELYDSPLMDVRIAFFDIKLSPSGGGSEEQTFSVLMQALKLYIDNKNKPFILIFWTEHKDLVERFIDFVHVRMDENLPSPFKIDCIDKLEIKDHQALMEKLRKIWEDPWVAVLFDFEEKASKAASSTINKFFEIIPSNDRWGENDSYIKNFEGVFSKIASHSFGFNYAKENPGKAVNEALLPILNYEFLTATNDSYWNNVLLSLNHASKESDLNYPENFSASKLNTIFHVDESNYFSTKTRGGVFLISMYDFFVPEEKQKFKLRYYFSLWGYFESLRIFMAEMFFCLNDKITTAKKNIIYDSCKSIVVEISASCDYSQNKNRTNKYVLGLLTYTFDRKEYLDKNRMSDSIFYKEIPVISYNDEDYFIWLNLNYIFSDTKVIEKIKEPLFILKKEMVDMIGNRYANHVSRIGITSF